MPVVLPAEPEPTHASLIRAGRPAPLMQSPLALRHLAYPNDVVNVPNFCHTRFLQRLENAGAQRALAERTLFDWYAATCDQWRGQRIGDREADFWDKRFEEWQGRTQNAATSMTSIAAQNAEILATRRREPKP